MAEEYAPDPPTVLGRVLQEPDQRWPDSRASRTVTCVGPGMRVRLRRAGAGADQGSEGRDVRSRGAFQERSVFR